MTAVKNEALEERAGEVLGPARREQRQRERDRLRERLRALMRWRVFGAVCIVLTVYLMGRLIARGQLFDAVTFTLGIALAAQVHLFLRDPRRRQIQSRLDALGDDDCERQRHGSPS